MAYHATHIPAQGHPIGAGIASGLRGFFESVQKAFAISRGLDQRIAAMDTLNAKTDAELADMGLHRDQIVNHVFRDLYYT